MLLNAMNSPAPRPQKALITKKANRFSFFPPAIKKAILLHNLREANNLLAIDILFDLIIIKFPKFLGMSTGYMGLQITFIIDLFTAIFTYEESTLVMGHHMLL